jgi:hypothetical protein
MKDIASIRKSVFPSWRGTSAGLTPLGRGAPVDEAVSVWTAEDLLEAGKKQVYQLRLFVWGRPVSAKGAPGEDRLDQAGAC